MRRAAAGRIPHLLVLLLLAAAGCAARHAAAEPVAPANQRDADEDPLAGAWDKDDQQADAGWPDPFEDVNRFVFQFNDGLYLYVVKPVATEWKRVVPENVRLGVRNVFSNVETPVRLVNCLLQGKFEGAGIEVRRFLINSTLGVGGIGDPAFLDYGLAMQREDFGQTLAVWGFKPGVYLVLPFAGPSSCRGAVGLVADSFLDPLGYLVEPWTIRAGLSALEGVNVASLRLGEYERLKRMALDPYIALRDAYRQRRTAATAE